MAQDVFISYASTDKEAALAICNSLEQGGTSCWIAPRNIEPGTDFPTAIHRAILASKVAVLIFSSEANASEYVNREVLAAVTKGVHLIPFRVENVEPVEGLALLLGGVQWLEANSGTRSKHLSELVKRVLRRRRRSRRARALLRRLRRRNFAERLEPSLRDPREEAE